MRYNAKILLFGEHTVVKGSKALAIPIPSHSGSWQFASAQEDRQKLQQKLPQLLQYLNKRKLNKVLNIAAFLEDLNKGLFFQSSIPTGYGMGSSGALCAAIFDRYKLRQEEDLIALKTLLGDMEHFFHGASSGIDPLVCYLNYPLLISNDGLIQKVQLSESIPFKKGAIFLLDTHIPRKTTPYVNGFLERYENDSYKQLCQSTLIPAVNNSIASCITGDWSGLYTSWERISQFQYLV